MNLDEHNEQNSTIDSGLALIEYFRLEGVNGYKTIELTCENGAKIVSAENGSGKTTLLNGLYGVLAGKPSMLQKINFERFSIKTANQGELTVEKSELSPLPSNVLDIVNEEYEQLAHFGRDRDGLVEALTKLALGQKDEFFDTEWFHEFYQRSPFDREDITSMCEDVVEHLSNDQNRFADIEEYVSRGLDGASVLYLPTYRRIEAEMPGSFQKSAGPFGVRPGMRPPSRYRRKSGGASWKSDQLIYFGLEDVENRLRSIAEKIKSGTFDAYTRIGGRTLEELLSGPDAFESSNQDIDLADLRVVLARLGKADGNVEARISDLINSGEIKQPQNEYLRSFLAQLLEVYASDKDQERAIEAFIDVINSYWSNDYDEKQFIFDKLTVSTRVENRFTGNSLPLNALSSGEKQIVSVFARLYLSGDSKFVVLIDEPELSLSMDWQRRFLPDILRSPSCAQMVAITHSPFVFDNVLDRYAGPLKITNRPANKG